VAYYATDRTWEGHRTTLVRCLWLPSAQGATSLGLRYDLVNMNPDQNPSVPEKPIPTDPETLDEEELRESPDSDENQRGTERKKEEWHSFEPP
jgi:hypothetical protein